MRTRLRPCPFCGSEKVYIFNPPTMDIDLSIRCPDCKAIMTIGIFTPVSNEDLRNTWNRRAEDEDRPD